MLGCLADNMLVRFIEGRMAEETAAQVRVHIDQCPRCLQLLAALGSEAEHADSGVLPPRPANSPAPQSVEEYQLLRPLGQGAMGEVYLAQDTRLDRQVAIKFLAAPDPDAAAYERFFIEARAIARLTHPNVVGIYRVGETEGRPYLVSEYIRGQSLAQLTKPVAPDRLLNIARGLASGLAAAHGRGVLHRDIKPANAILTDEGQVKLLDFGLAKLVDAAQSVKAAAAVPHLEPIELPRSPALQTQSGALIGTPAYLAPELWQGAPATAQADIYSLGALLYELASGHLPQRAHSLRELRRCILEQDARPLHKAAPGIDSRLASLIDRCLQREPGRRFASAEELGSALALLAESVPAPSQAEPRRRSGGTCCWWRWCRSSSWPERIHIPFRIRKSARAARRACSK